ncbi:MAG: hypothetical protein IH623_15075 [Verrucomicrobia bacterium]|nr:hypothetical protein [Verrucomicrobiota bacterium]
MRRHTLTLAAITALGALTVDFAEAQSSEVYEQPPVNYSSTSARDAITQLQARLVAGKLKFTGSGKDIVQTLLRELAIPVESQMLVFSKTSFQRKLIRPDRPRAIYFSDTCYVGWVPYGLIEIAAIDPELGPVFYSLDPNAAAPHIVRDNDCLSCHGGAFVRGIPGVFARSVFTDAAGEPLLRHGSEVVDFRTPFTNRWGGWYVTGQHGDSLHRGNVLARDQSGKLLVDLERGANLPDLSGFFEPKSYLSEGSDIVALLVFEHQIAMQNTLTRAGINCRRMLTYQQNLQRDFKEPVTEELTYDSVKRVFDSSAKDVVDDLLFKDEAPLPEGLAGSAAFQNAFQATARRGDDGSSLREFHLQGHLFKNRCSYLIYSESFLALPAALKRRVYERLVHALHPAKPDPQYAYLDADERARISRILKQTHPELRNALEASN